MNPARRKPPRVKTAGAKKLAAHLRWVRDRQAKREADKLRDTERELRGQQRE